MYVTTGYDPTEETLRYAEELARRLGLPLRRRGNFTLNQLRRRYGDEPILVVNSQGVRLEATGKKPFFFHPNTAAFRIKRLMRGDTDTMLMACQIQPGDRVLDATLGLGADAIVFAHAVGEKGKVVGVESEPLIALLVEEGLRTWQADVPALNEAMRRVEVRQGNHAEVLASLPDRSFDVVYFDPMFEKAVESSSGIAGLRAYANPSPLEDAAVEEALRVAARRVVLKEGKEGRLYARFGFTPVRTRTQHVLYSYKETGGGE